MTAALADAHEGWHMRRNARSLGVTVFGVGLALAIGACSLKREEPKVEENLFPTDYRAEIVKAMPKLLADMTGIRNASVSEPALMTVGDERRYFVCVRYTPRKAAFSNDYGSPEERLAVFFAGKLNQFIDSQREHCARAAFQPFPELEKACFGPQCGQRK
jgi:hypothetical protein